VLGETRVVAPEEIAQMDDRESGGVTRRDFAKVTAVVGAGLLATHGRRALASTGGKRRYAIVGVGQRSEMYRRAIHKTFADHAELVACCDTNKGRLQMAQGLAVELGCPEPRAYGATEFERMIAECHPDTVIVTTVDGFHDHYLCRAMELGVDTITEKPMTIDAETCARILATQRQTKRRCTVTFNYRYSPARSQVKELLDSGLIGHVLSVDFHWMLNTHHGADYFRRWHSQKKMSGGLMLHKASHHFDLVNWWLSAVPVGVTATGKREFYTPAMISRMGLATHHERCLGCPEKGACGFELDIAANPNLKRYYLDNEAYDGYLRDRCVFRPDIDIEDTMNVLVTYDTHATLCYSLNAFNGWEGYVVSFNGTKGRLEHKMEELVYVSGDGSVPGAIKKEGTSIRVFPLREAAYQIEPRKGEGGHAGGDDPMLRDLFHPDRLADPLLRAADQRAGACAVLIGAAANSSFASGQPVAISDLVKDLERPDYPAMPRLEDPVPMPSKVAPPPRG
jgi:predicted dehydrogenase